jgi:hypothetical protein
MPSSPESTALCRNCGSKVVPLGFLREWRYGRCQRYQAGGKAGRRARWDAGERPPCRQHSERIVKRSMWIASPFRLAVGRARRSESTPCKIGRQTTRDTILS